MPLAALGQPYTVSIPVRDANGSPVTSGVTGTGNLYGPGSATALLTGIALTHQGNGLWGATLAASSLTANGRYLFTVPTLTAGALVQSGVDVVFTVGAVAPWMQTLRQIVEDLTAALEDGFGGTSDGGGTTTTLIDSRLIDVDAGTSEYKGSELLILEPVSGAASLHKITGFNGLNGTLTFTPAAAGSVASGTDYLLSFLNGRGFTHAQKLAAIKGVVNGARVRIPTSDQVTLTSTLNDFRYQIPDEWVSVLRSAKVRPVNHLYEGDWQTLAPHHVAVDTAARQLLIRATLFQYQVWIEGSYAPRVPDTLTGLVPLPGDWVVDAAHARLKLQRGGPEGLQQLGAMLAQPRYRGLYTGNRWRANEISLL